MIYFNKLIDICINRYESQKVVDNYFVGTNNVSVQTQRTDKYKNQSEMVDFFFCNFSTSSMNGTVRNKKHSTGRYKATGEISSMNGDVKIW